MSHECRDTIIKEIKALLYELRMLDDIEEFDYNDLYHGVDDIDLVALLMKLLFTAGKKSAYGITLTDDARLTESKNNS